MKAIDIINQLPIENTPIIKLKNGIYLKLEFLNFGGSIKSRVAKYMIIDALKSGKLSYSRKEIILEASGGNTAMGLIQIATRLNWKCVFCIPDNYSKDRINELKYYGAEVFLSDHKNGNDSHIKLAQELKRKNQHWYYIDQLNNLSNINAHYQGTGSEILRQLNKIDYFVSGIGSGGTITGIGKKLKEVNRKTKVIGVLPKGYSIINKIFIPHKIQGIGIGKVPKILDLSIIDEFTEVSNEDLYNTASYLMKKENLFLGMSSIANISAAIKLKSKIPSTKNIITIALIVVTTTKNFINKFLRRNYHDTKNILSRPIFNKV